MAILNPDKVAARQRKRHPKAFADMDELGHFREFQRAEMERLKIPKRRRRLAAPAVIRKEEPQ